MPTEAATSAHSFLALPAWPVHDGQRNGNCISNATRAACLESKKMRRRAPRGMKNLIHPRASAEPVSSALLLLQDVAPGNAGSRGSYETGPQMTLTKISGETTATHQPAISVPSILRLQPPSVKSLQPGDSMPGCGKWVTRLEKIGLSNLKASGLSCSG